MLAKGRIQECTNSPMRLQRISDKPMQITDGSGHFRPHAKNSRYFFAHLSLELRRVQHQISVSPATWQGA